MFTGIVDRLGRVELVERRAKAGRLFIKLSKAWDRRIVVGESIAVNGVCLTVVKWTKGSLRFDVLEETFRKTNLGYKQAGAVVNLERALRLGDPMGGHIVTGHVDTAGRLAEVRRHGRDWILKITCPAELMPGIVHKGSVALDGISLTVVDVMPAAFTVHIIPHTWHNTDLSSLEEGDRINIELDMLGKFVQRAISGLVPAPRRQRRAKR